MKALLTALIVFGLSCNVAASVQVCASGRPLVAPDSRYTDNGDGTITDNQTTLMWKQCSEGQTEATCVGAARRMTWPEAIATSADANFAGFDDWRLPKADELKGLIESACSNPAINERYFANTYAGGYWTSSKFEGDDDYIRYVEFQSGKSSYNGESTYYAVRLVRDVK